jgi:hypothetical protein
LVLYKAIFPGFSGRPTARLGVPFRFGASRTLQGAENLPKGVILSEAKNLSSSKMPGKKEILRAKPTLRMTSTLFPHPVLVRERRSSAAKKTRLTRKGL